MGAEAGLIEAAEAIKQAVTAFVAPEESGNIRLFESSPGHLRVVVGSDRFKGKGPAECQDLIWAHLSDNVAEEQLVYCFGVHPMDVKEYEEEFASQSVAEYLTLFIEGRSPMGEDTDE